MKRFVCIFFAVCIIVSCSVIPCFASEVSSYTFVIELANSDADGSYYFTNRFDSFTPDVRYTCDFIVTSSTGSSSITSVDVSFSPDGNGMWYAVLGPFDNFFLDGNPYSNLTLEITFADAGWFGVLFRDGNGWGICSQSVLELTLTEVFEPEPTEGDTVPPETTAPIAPSDGPSSGNAVLPMDTVDDGLAFAISWVGTVARALMDGPLTGLLSLVAVAISISALLLAIRIIKKFGWGM